MVAALTRNHIAAGGAITVLAAASLAINWPRHDDPGVSFPAPPSAAELAAMPDRQACERAAIDISRRLLVDDALRWRALPEAPRAVFIAAALEPAIRSGGILDTALAERAGSGHGRPRLADLVEAYRSMGVAAAADAAAEAVAILDRDAETLAAWESWRERGIGQGLPEPANPFRAVDARLIRAIAEPSALATRAAYVRAHAAEILGR